MYFLGNKFKHLTWWQVALILLGALLILGLGTWALHRLRRIPSARAAEYLNAVLPDFQSLQAKLSYYQGGFASVAKSLDKSKTAFYEVTTTRTYGDAVIDTRQDIVDITETLNLIASASAAQQQATPPAELADFDRNLTQYYASSKAALEQLMIHEQFQMTMLDASGDELNNALKTYDALVNKGITDGLNQAEMVEFMSLLKKINYLARESVEKFNEITLIPEEEKAYYAFQKEFHEDVAGTFGVIYIKLNQYPEDWSQILSVELSEFLKRSGERQKAREADTKNWMETTQIKVNFEAAAAAETQLTAFIELFQEQYDFAINLTPTPTIATGSGELAPSVTPLPSLEISPSAAPVVSPTVIVLSPTPAITP